MNTSEQKVSSVEINCKCEAQAKTAILNFLDKLCLLYTSPSPRDRHMLMIDALLMN